MPDTNDYIKRYNQTNNDLVRPTGMGEGDDYYKLARDQEYGLLFDKEVALENAKANALKYTQNQINSQGFGGTGYGSSMQSGIYNAYLNRANEARNDYAQNIRDINVQEQQAATQEANDRFESVTTMLQDADTLDNMNKLLVDYGFGSMDGGTFKWNESKPEGMSDDDWYQMQFYYRMKANDLSEQSGDFTGAYYTDPKSFMNARVPVEGGRTMKVEGNFDKEAPILFSHINAGDVNYGDYVKVTNGYGDKLYVQRTERGLRICSEKEYNEAKNKHEIVRDGRNKYSWDSGRESKYIDRDAFLPFFHREKK